MKVKDLIKLNNKKRENLTKENLTYYGDMLVYIRLASNKSERETEEILLELLDHTLDAQEEERTVKDVFGDDLKQYCQELIEEIPQETFKKQVKFSIYIILGFLSVVGLTHGIIRIVLNFFKDGAGLSTFSIGSGIAIIFINMIVIFIFIFWLLKWMKDSTFKEKEKKPNKWLEFFQIWLGFMFVFGLFFLIVYFMPNFGPIVTIKAPWFIAIGAGLYLLSRLFKN